MSQLSDKETLPSSEGGRDSDRTMETRMSGASIGRTILLDDPPNTNMAPLFLQKPRPLERSQQGQQEQGQKPPTGKERPSEKSASSIRKRSRLGDNTAFDRLKLNEEGGYKKKIDDYLLQLLSLTETIIKKGDKSKLTNDKALLTEVMKDVSNEVVKILSSMNAMAERILQLYDGKQAFEQRIIKLSEENNCLRQQVIETQAQSLQTSSTTSTPYMQAVLKNMTESIKKGTALPVPVIPDTVKHSPAERILLFKAKTKAEQVSKKEQESFRKDLMSAIGVNLMKQLDVIRPTRFGGYTVIFRDENSRDKALNALRENENKAGIEEKASCIIAPKKKLAKAICRVPPDDVNPDNFLNDLYGSYNPHLQKIPKQRREARIITSSVLGWIFELSSEEAQAFFQQNGRLRYGFGRELKVEEFIPLQQCYRCSAFGHNASECTSEKEFCRLCAKVGHAGKDCTYKDDKSKWKCVNCKIINETKGYKLSTEHAAAQLHKCPCAHNQKMIKKEQLAAAGVFTTPISETLIQEYERTSSKQQTQGLNGTQQQKRSNERSTSTRRRRNRSDSQKGKIQLEGKNTQVNKSSSSSSTQITIPNNYSQQANSGMITLPRSSSGVQSERLFLREEPKVTEGWKIISENRNIVHGEERGRDNSDKQGGTNSTSSLGSTTMMDTEDHME